MSIACGAIALATVGMPFLFLCWGNSVSEREIRPLHTHTGSRTHLGLSQLLSGDCCFCWDFLTVQAQQTATHSTQLWQMCSFLLYSLNSAWESCKKNANLHSSPQTAFLQDPVQFLVSFMLFSDQQRYEKNSIITHTLLWCVGTNSTCCCYCWVGTGWRNR